MTYLAPIFIWLLVYYWAFVLEISPMSPFGWHVMILVATLTFFPSVRAFWGLREHSSKVRLLLALDAALPFAIIGILFGEFYTATQGLGLLIAIARATRSTVELFALFVVTISLFIVLSASLRVAARKFLLSSSATKTA